MRKFRGYLIIKDRKEQIVDEHEVIVERGERDAIWYPLYVSSLSNFWDDIIRYNWNIRKITNKKIEGKLEIIRDSEKQEEYEFIIKLFPYP